MPWEGTPGQIVPESDIDWLEGQGTAEDPYRVVTVDQFILLSKASILWDKNFVLVTDIDLYPNLPSAQVFVQAPIQTFRGVFDGNGHKIFHLTIKDGSYLGLFGRLESGAKISNLGLEAVDVNGTGDYIGGLVGTNRGSITACYSSCMVNEDKYVGGLVGGNDLFGSVTINYSTGLVRGWSPIRRSCGQQ